MKGVLFLPIYYKAKIGRASIPTEIIPYLEILYAKKSCTIYR